MDEMEMTRLMKELTKLLQNTSVSIEETKGCLGPGIAMGLDLDLSLDLDERFEVIKRELGSWFIEGYQLYQAS
ncbi:MAG: hypothetical protein U9N01_06585 [Euryarchaeota archaeon]|nr:hypothetical protein [Euryarchaeota archaeon]